MPAPTVSGITLIDPLDNGNIGGGQYSYVDSAIKLHPSYAGSTVVSHFDPSPNFSSYNFSSAKNLTNKILYKSLLRCR